MQWRHHPSIHNIFFLFFTCNGRHHPSIHPQHFLPLLPLFHLRRRRLRLVERGRHGEAPHADARDEAARQQRLVSTGHELDDGAHGEDGGEQDDGLFPPQLVGQRARGQGAEDAPEGEEGGDPPLLVGHPLGVRLVAQGGPPEEGAEALMDDEQWGGVGWWWWWG